MTVLVTGGAGFIGSNFVLDWLAASEEPVVNVDALTYAGNLENLNDLRTDVRHRFVHGDICDRALLDRLMLEFKPRAVVHFAAESHVDRSIHGPGAFVRTNIEGTFQLLEAARAHLKSMTAGERENFRFLHVSTDEVYGSLQPGAAAFTEQHAYEPNSPYSASKAASDHLVRAWHHTYGVPVITTNCSNNYGPYQFPEKLIPLMIVNALAGKPLPVYGDGMQVRDWLFVKDHCSAIRCVLERGRPGETYNIGGWNEQPNILIVRTICALLDELRHDPAGPHARLISYVTDRPGHDRRYAIDARKIERELGWRPAETFETGIRKTIAWYLEHAQWLAHVQSGSYRDWVTTQYARENLVKILLLGKNGQVGWELRRSLAVLGEVVALDRSDPTPLTADLSRPQDLVEIVRRIAPDVIVNAAAYTAVDRAESESETAQLINAIAPAALAREAARQGAWLLHYSSDYVFDGSGSEPWTEEAPTGPLNVYGQTKLAGERAIRESGCKHLILRTSWVYAARGSNFARTMLKLAQERDHLRVVDDQFGAPTGADLLADLSAHLIRLAREQPGLSGTYHAVPAGCTSWHGYAKHLIECARSNGAPIKVAPEAIEAVSSDAFPTPARRPRNSRLDTSKLRRAFGLELPDWRRGVERTLTELLGR